MVSYRFLRPDDMPLIAEAVRCCHDPHFPGQPTASLEGLKQESLELNLWASSCMVALEGIRPVAILTGAKREGITNVLRIGAAPGYEGRGHGSHLLESLHGKLAIIGPPDLVTEVPDNRPRVGRFFEKCGYSKAERLTDFHLDDPVPELSPSDAFATGKASAFLEDAGLWRHRTVAWVRSQQTLLNLKDNLQGAALVSPERVEAAILYQKNESGPGCTLFRFGYREPRQGLVFVSLLTRYLAQTMGLPLVVPKLEETELPGSMLTAMGFKAVSQYQVYRNHVVGPD